MKHPFPMDTHFGSVTILRENHEIEAGDDICKILKDYWGSKKRVALKDIKFSSLRENLEWSKAIAR